MVDFPTLGSPTIPILRVLPGLPQRIFCSSVLSFFLGGIDILNWIFIKLLKKELNNIKESSTQCIPYLYCLYDVKIFLDKINFIMIKSS